METGAEGSNRMRNTLSRKSKETSKMCHQTSCFSTCTRYQSLSCSDEATGRTKKIPIMRTSLSVPNQVYNKHTPPSDILLQKLELRSIKCATCAKIVLNILGSIGFCVISLAKWSIGILSRWRLIKIFTIGPYGIFRVVRRCRITAASARVKRLPRSPPNSVYSSLDRHI